MVSAQAAVGSARFFADVATDGPSARIRVVYEVVGAEPGGTIPATLLAFGVAEPTSLRMGAEGRAGVFARGPKRAWTASLPVEVTPSGAQQVVAEYTVPFPALENGDVLRVHLPVLSLDLAPDEAQPGLFQALVTLPAAWRISETFPTGLRAADAPGHVGDGRDGRDGDDGGDGRDGRDGRDGAVQVHAVDLQVVPAAVSFRARTDGAWRPGLPLLLEVITGLILAVFSFFGWRHLKEGLS
jgi:hypothetical protein